MSSHTPLQIVHLDRATIGPSVVITKPQAQHQWTSYDKTAADEVVTRLAQADIAVVNKVAITKEHLAQLPQLKMIAISATGFDKIDIAACHAQNIVVCNITDYAKQTVPEHCFALILALRRSITAYHEAVRNGAWQESGQFCFFTYPISDLHGATLGLIGTGSIGSQVAQIAKAFGMRVLRAERKNAPVIRDGYSAFDEVITTADIISLHCPLNDETKDLISLSEMQQMAQKPLLINCSRGGLVNEADLITALDEGLIAGAALDVLTTEPPDESHIIMQNLGRPNLVVTPHVAWASDQAMQILWDQLIGHIDHFVKGTPRNQL